MKATSTCHACRGHAWSFQPRPLGPGCPEACWCECHLTFAERTQREIDARQAQARRDEEERVNCPLRAPHMRGVTRRELLPRTCWMDGEPLGKGRKRWCSERCAATYWRNHGWAEASGFARFRSQIPLVSGIATYDNFERAAGYYIGEVAVLSRSLHWRRERCGRRSSDIEINHVVPRVGAGYGEGCHHHQTNLEPLCHECHVAETTAQIRERNAAKARDRAVALGAQLGVP